MKVAIIVIGQLRFRNREHLIDFKNKIDGFDTFVSTYNKYRFHASKLTSFDRCIFHREQNIRVSMNNMLQWYHLDSIIEKYSKELEDYDIIIKLRTDIDFIKLDLALKMCGSLDSNTIYSCTDILFYAKTEHFLHIFRYFWENILDDYANSSGLYKSINYKNIIDSNDNILATQDMGARFTWLIVPRFIFSESFNVFKENIRKNITFLERLNGNKTKYSDFKNYRFESIGNRVFSSEQIFCLHCFNCGKIENSKIKIKLLSDRHTFNY